MKPARLASVRPRFPAIHGHSPSRLASMGLAALGIVFGDIGTSPLYTLKSALALTGGQPQAAVLLGLLSLVIWTLLVVVTVKYVLIAMSIDNHGEGGILALMSLVSLKKPARPAIIVAGLAGAALIYGDGAITPAISVLSALEGLNMATPAVQPFVLPAAIGILVLLFVIQPFGSETIGKAFGPVMALWFGVLAAMGIAGIAHHPGVLVAVDPLFALRYLASAGSQGFMVLGAVFLCVTGAEALYADMGHFGPRPIRIAWLLIVFPSLVLNYAGQVAIVLDGAPVDGNIFYRLCPAPLLIPLVILATLATVIASQAIITGAFSMTRQAIRLGWMPRLAIKQTSDEGYGQIYVGSINWILMAATLALTIGFRQSDHLASAYGIAVSLTMLMTTLLLFIAMHEIRHWSRWRAGGIAALLLIVDALFVGANSVKIADGGYVPLLIAAIVYGVMWIWHRGSTAVRHQLTQNLPSIAQFKALLMERKTPRVPGTAIFLTGTDEGVPLTLTWHVQHNRALHENVMILTVKTLPIPWTRRDQRLQVEEPEPHLWRAQARYGFMEHADIPDLLQMAKDQGCHFESDDVTYYIGRASIVRKPHRSGLPGWQEGLYAALDRNSSHVSEVLRLPPEQTVELGRQIAI